MRRGYGNRRLRKTNQATALYRVAGIARSDTITDTSTTPHRNVLVSAVADPIAVSCIAFSFDRFRLTKNGPTRLAVPILILTCC
jgi:hypothetical protein